MLKSVRFFLFLSFIIIAFIATKTFAATYSCPDIRQYISCNAGYYLNNTDVGNSCVLCPSGYTSTEGATSINECYINVPGAYHIANVYDSTPIICNTGEYKEAHRVYYGESSSCNRCLEGYTSEEAGTDSSSCKIYCAGGSYLANANDTICSNVGIGYWAAESVVSQGEVGVRNPCSDGMTTIGFGTGADEIWDCGRILHIGDNKIYLRSKSKTTPSLNVRIDGTTYYGNMSTDIKGNLRIKSGTTTYSVYDDSM